MVMTLPKETVTSRLARIRVVIETAISRMNAEKDTAIAEIVEQLNVALVELEDVASLYHEAMIREADDILTSRLFVDHDTNERYRFHLSLSNEYPVMSLSQETLSGKEDS